MILDFLYKIFEIHQHKASIIWRNKVITYHWLHTAIKNWQSTLEKEEIAPGTVIEISGDFSPNAVALLLALIEYKCIIVPLTASVQAKKAEFRDIAEIEMTINLDENDQVTFVKYARCPNHLLLQHLRTMQHPGLILFSSGSTGKSKAAVHDFLPLLDKFAKQREPKRIITFLLFDHIGGINTLLHTIANGGCVIVLEDRTPAHVCKAIEQHKAQVLPTSPTFINLLLLSGIYKNYDLSSLELVTYGTEVMPESTLSRFNAIFSQIKLSQTYGLSEVGILRTKSKASNSLFMRVGGEGYETRIVNNMLEIKAKSAMLGYLNAPSPFTEDGWFKTGDIVEQDGDFIQIMGRNSEIINVGGEKVYPAQVESVLQMMKGVEDVAVTGEKNPLIGQIIKAKIKLTTGESPAQFRQRMWEFCKDKIPPYMIPQKIIITEDATYGERFKRMRNFA